MIEDMDEMMIVIRKCLFAHTLCGRSVLFAHSPGYLLSCNYMILCKPAAQLLQHQLSKF